MRVNMFMRTCNRLLYTYTRRCITQYMSIYTRALARVNTLRHMYRCAFKFTCTHMWRPYKAVGLHTHISWYAHIRNYVGLWAYKHEGFHTAYVHVQYTTHACERAYPCVSTRVRTYVVYVNAYMYDIVVANIVDVTACMQAVRAQHIWCTPYTHMGVYTCIYTHMGMRQGAVR